MVARVKHAAESRGFREPACVLALALLGGLFFFRLANFRTRWFNPDELEHMHVSWCIAKGMVPYRDFFEHHTPWLWYMLAPLLAGEAVASDLGPAVQALTSARATSLVLSAASLCALIWLGRIWSGPLCGALSALFLAGTRIFFDKTVEVRPDVGSLFLWIGCLVGLAYALGGGDPSRDRRGPVLAAGLCLGAAVMFQQKILFVIPGLGLAGCAWILLGAPGSVRLARLCAAGWFVVGLCAPLAATWACFAALGAGWDFFNWNFLLNARWRSGEPREPWLRQIGIDEGRCCSSWRAASRCGSSSWPAPGVSTGSGWCSSRLESTCFSACSSSPSRGRSTTFRCCPFSRSSPLARSPWPPSRYRAGSAGSHCFRS
jgi:hypothetical protein